MIRDELEKVVEKFYGEEFGDIENTEGLDEAVEQFFSDKGIPCVTSQDEMFDNSGCDIYSYSVAWIENNKPELLVYRIFIS